jgi:hypothetical protein
MSIYFFVFYGLGGNSAFGKKCHSVLDTESMKWPFYVDSRQLACRRQACATMTFEKKFHFKRHKQNCCTG